MSEIVTGRVRAIEQALGGRAVVVGSQESGTPLGLVRIVKCPFAFDTPDLLTGARIATVDPGDVLLCGTYDVPTLWDQPAFASVYLGDATKPLGPVVGETDLTVANPTYPGMNWSGVAAAFPGITGYATLADLYVVVSGTVIGGGVRSDATPLASPLTQGAATLYLMLATPASS